MTVETSSLVFGVKTDSAINSLRLLQAELDKTLAKFAQTASATGNYREVNKVAAGHEAVTRALVLQERTAKAAAEATDQMTKASKEGLRSSLSYSQKIGAATASLRFNAKTSANEIVKEMARIGAAANDPKSAAGLMKILGENKKRNEEAIKQAAQMDKLNQSYNSRTLKGRLNTIEQILRMQRKGYSEEQLALRYGNQAMREVDKVHKMRTAQTQLEHLQKRHAQNRKYDAMDLSARAKTLARIAELEAMGLSRRAIINIHGTTAFSQRNSLSDMQAQVAAQANLAKEQRNVGKAAGDNSSRLRESAQAMRDVHGAARGLSGSLGALWMTYGSIAPLIAGAAVGTIARDTFRTGSQVEFRLQMLKALGNDPVSVDQMMPAVMGSMKTPLEAAEGLQTLAQAGLNTREALATLPTTLQLAALGEMSVSNAALTATAALSTFGLQAHEATRVGDIFAKGASISNASISELASSMVQAGSGAAAYGLTLEETVAQLTTLAQAGIKGSAAGTAVKNAMKELYAPTDKARKAMEQIRLNIYDPDGQARNFIDILRDLRTSMSTMGEESRNNLLGDMFNERSRRAIQIYMNDFGKLEDMVKEMYDPDGYLANANAMLLDTVEGAGNRFRSVLEQSYVKGFEALKPQIRTTIEAMEQFVGSEAFVGGIQTLGSAVTGLTTLVIEHEKAIKVAVVAYAAFKLAQVGAGSMSVFIQGMQTMNAAVMRNATAVQTTTAALNSNTLAQNANNAATAAGATFISRASSAANGFAIALRGVTASMGVIGLVWAGASLAMSTYSNRAADAEEKSVSLRQRVDDMTKSLWAEVAAHRARNAEILAGAGITPTSAKDTIESLRKQAANLFEREQELEARRSQLLEQRRKDGAGSLFLDGAPNSMRDSELAKVSAQLNQVSAERRKTEESLLRVLNAQTITAESRQTMGLMSGIETQLNMLKRYRDDILMSSKDSALRPMQDPLEALQSELKTTLDAIASGVPVAQSTIDGLTTKVGEFQRKIQEAQTTEYKKLGGGGGGLEFRSSTSNIMQELNNQKKLYEQMRDFRLKYLDEQRKLGVVSSDEAASQRASIWDEYFNKYQAAAQSAAGRIRAIDKGSPLLHELAQQRLAEQVNHERRMADQQLIIDNEKEYLDNQLQGLKLWASTVGDLRTIGEELDRDIVRRRQDMFKGSLRNDELAAFEARNATEDKYNKLLKDRQKILNKLTAFNPDYLNTEHGQALQKSILDIEAEKAIKSVEAADKARKDYMDTQSIGAGYSRALKELGDQAISVGDLVQQSLTQSFQAVGNLAGELVTTGKVNVRSFFADLTAQVAKMYMNHAVMSILGMFLPKLGGAAVSIDSGGFAGTQSPAPVTNLGRDLPSGLFGSMHGNAFASGSHIARFRQGGAFTNKVTTGLNIAPMAMLGEAGPEAILPLTRTSRGDLGVKASVPEGVGGGSQIAINTVVNVEGGKTESSTSSAGNSQMFKAMAKEIEQVSTAVIQKHLGQGGMIRRAMKEGR